MKVTKEKAAENRERILTEASRLFRERGFASVGVDALAEAAGLTHGSLYSQFGSKERLAAEALAHASAASGMRTANADTFAAYVTNYLSAAHRDRPGSGCALAALGGEISRQSDPIRHSFTAAVRRLIARLASLMPDRSRREQDALAAVATMVGGLILARAVDDPDLSDRILGACRDRLIQDAPGNA